MSAVHLSDSDVFPMRDLWGTLLWLQRRSGADLVMSQEDHYSNTGSILYMVNNRTLEVCLRWHNCGLAYPLCRLGEMHV